MPQEWMSENSLYFVPNSWRIWVFLLQNTPLCWSVVQQTKQSTEKKSSSNMPLHQNTLFTCLNWTQSLHMHTWCIAGVLKPFAAKDPCSLTLKLFSQSPSVQIFFMKIIQLFKYLAHYLNVYNENLTIYFKPFYSWIFHSLNTLDPSWHYL